MPIPKPVTIDFETEAIQDRPRYPPEPVGVSIKFPGRKSKYYAWGHPIENNCTKQDAARILADIYRSKADILHHNGKFDIDVAQTHMPGCGDVYLDPLRCHDTQFLLFLFDPHSYSLQLKPSAEKHLGLPPEEQDAVRDWLIAHQAQLKAAGHLGATARITTGNFGAWIAYAPGKLVGKYAEGDTARAEKLFQYFYPQLIESGMLAAYQREQRLVPILLRNEREGMRCDLPGLERDVVIYEKAQQTAERWLRKRLGVPDLDFNKDRDVADALDNAGIVTEWSYTKTGLKSVSKKLLKPSHYHDPRVFQVLGYWNKLATCLGTYYRPWIATARETGGILHAGWNQTRNDRDAGTRTGRLSATPNYMAVAKSFEDKGDGWSHPSFIRGLPHLPMMRRYLLADAEGHIWGRRDYNQQELRILAHFEDGQLQNAYRTNPKLDVHSFVQKEIQTLLGIDLPRTPIKTLNFGLIYGQGVPSMAEKLNCEVAEVKKFREAQFAALPGLKDLDRSTKARGKAGQPIRTWGGRLYYCEEPRIIEGRYRTFEYKLLNYLIQGSAADCTKEALVRWDAEHGKTSPARFVVTVHDEINVSAPKKAFKAEMLKLRAVMQSVEFDVPMLSDAEYGNNWGDMQPLDEPQPTFNLQ